MALEKNDNWMDEAIRVAIEDRVAAVAESEVQLARERVSTAVRDALAQITLSILDEYSVEYMRNSVIIHVKNSTGNTEVKND